MKDKILLGGFYGFDNIGDEAVLAAIVAAIRQVDEKIPLMALSHQPQKTAAAYEILAVDRWQSKTVRRALSDARLFVLGGGSLLQDVTGMKSLLFYLRWLWQAQRAKTPVFVYAQGIGPIQSKWGRKLTAHFLKKAAGVSLRDQASYEQVLSWGADPAKVSLTVDPVLAWQTETPVPVALPAGHKIAFALRAWPGFSPQKAARVADHFAERGYQIVFFPFHTPADTVFAQEVAAGMRNTALVLEQTFTASQAAAIIRQMDLVWGMRLHALVLAAAAGVPFAALNYDPKVAAFARELPGIPCCGIQDSPEAMIVSLQEAWQNREQIREALRPKRDIWQAKAKQTAALTVELYREAK